MYRATLHILFDSPCLLHWSLIFFDGCWLTSSASLSLVLPHVNRRKQDQLFIEQKLNKSALTCINSLYSFYMSIHHRWVTLIDMEQEIFEYEQFMETEVSAVLIQTDTCQKREYYRAYPWQQYPQDFPYIWNPHWNSPVHLLWQDSWIQQRKYNTCSNTQTDWTHIGWKKGSSIKWCGNANCNKFVQQRLESIENKMTRVEE